MMRRQQFEELQRRLDRIDERIKTMEVSLLISGPSNPVVADAYNGLRQQVVMSASERRAHLTQLAHFASAVDDGASATELASLVREWMSQHSLIVVAPETHPDAYEVHGSGPHRAVRKLAYVDERSGAVVSLGHVVASPPPPAHDARSQPPDRTSRSAHVPQSSDGPPQVTNEQRNDAAADETTLPDGALDDHRTNHPTSGTVSRPFNDSE